MNHSHATPYILTIRGNQLQKQITFHPNQLRLNVTAKNNLSFSNISFELKNENIIGWIELDLQSNKATLQRLEIAQDDGLWSIYAASPAEENHATYQIRNQGSYVSLDLYFDGMTHYHPDHAPIAETLDNVVIRFNHHPTSEERQFVRLSGHLQLQIPQHWAVLQPNRFPKLLMQGQFIFENKAYTLIHSHTDSTHLSTQVFIFAKFLFKHQNDNIALHIEQKSIFSRPKIELVTSSQVYKAETSFFHKMGIENEKQIYITANNFILTAKNGQRTQIQANLIIPKSYSNLTVNQQQFKMMHIGSHFIAETINQQKTYCLFFHHQKDIVTLWITEEAVGHFSLRYSDITNEQYECGDSDTPCEGLTVNANKQRFYLNQVRFGQHILHGEIFIAGIL